MKIATATPVCATLYGVTYSDSHGCDRDVPYAYLERLATLGYTVQVQTGHGVTAHRIPQRAHGE